MCCQIKSFIFYYFTAVPGPQISVKPVAMTPLRASAGHISVPVNIEEHVAMIPYPIFETDIFGLIRPYEASVSA